MARRLSAEERAELEGRREALQLELRLVEAELRSDEALRLQDRAGEERGRPRLDGRWRDWVRWDGGSDHPCVQF
jgi:hypothetical protein